MEDERRIFVLGDLTVKVGSVKIGYVVRKCGIDAVIEDCHYLVDAYVERGLFLLRTFRH